MSNEHTHREPIIMTEAEMPVTNKSGKKDRRTRQRTFEGAYWRTCLSSFGFALVVLRIFEPAFYRIGLVFVAYGGVLLCIAAIRRQRNKDVFDTSKPFITSGGYVILTGLMGLATYVVLLTMILKMGS
ncbi:hypothetical protein G9A89_019909 [Geosiphon pyriformis]|nr:hypothetical protein G9A89_019909 [Geosiphon pyriformis]